MEVLEGVDHARLEALRARDEFFWLDLRDPSTQELEDAGALLGLHPLALEDSIEFAQRPKLDRYPDGLLLVYWSARVTANGLSTEPVEVHLHVSGGFLATVRHGPCDELDALHQQLPAESAHEEDYVVYRILDALTDALYPVIDHVEARIDALEAVVLRDVRQSNLGEIYRLKQEVQHIQRRMVPQRDQFDGVSEAILALPGLTHGTREYLSDIGDHLAQISGELYRQTDDLAGLTSTYFNASQGRVNRLAARLTVIATFFFVWTLVTSFFGQNFGWLVDHIDSLEAFLIYEGLGLVLPTVAAAVYFWRRRREWL